MSYVRYLARRAAFAVLSVSAVLTVTFFLINLTLWQEMRNRAAFAEWGGADPEQVNAIRQQFLARRNLDQSLHERYVDWLVDVTTFEWGYSFAYRQPVIDVLDGRVQTTLGYVLPGVALAVLPGVLLGLFAALSKDSTVDWSSRVVAYALLGVPAFMVVLYYQLLSGAALVTVGGFALVAPTLGTGTLAALTVATSLVAGQIRFSRAAALEQSGQAFVKMLRAKGAGRLRLARHVLRNAAIPIVSLSMSELLAVLMLDVYVVEEVLGIKGLAAASLRAARTSDVALVIWSTMIIVVIGVAGNFLQDVLYGYLDPRVRAE